MAERWQHGVVAVVAAATLTACGPDAPRPTPDPDRTSMSTATPAAKNGTGEERHDLAPLTKRFSRLGEPVAATWYSGTLGSDRAPGPTSYWIDAVVELEPATVKELVAQFSPEPVDTTPDVVDDLEPALPAGELIGSKQLSEAFSSAGFSTTAWLDVTGRRLVLTAKGQGS